ncbi:hypothetical protein B0H63DRAFT_520573 [Podospora didyma]|uniref:Heterokaryon incompatibility domain-containing protein n=1 Tax=Podospora didyma TaxID=330526 RepID=A0AAE0NRR6_9PEZI|nr:hypothetical protein B0H63DRAFT_520573 [Podospora didyma]
MAAAAGWRQWLQETPPAGYVLYMYLKWDAARLDAEGRTEEAEGLFAAAVSGFRHLLSETHSSTVKAVYQLAAFYANHDRMADADKSEQTLAHYLRVILLLHSWNREEHAQVFVFRITEALQDDECDGQLSAPQIPGDHQAHIQSAVDDLDDESDESSVDNQLRIADLWVSSGSATIERILPRLMDYCNSNPKQLAVQGLQARCQLARFHVMRKNSDEAARALLNARRALSQTISNQSDPNTIPDRLPSVARKLAFLHLDNDDETHCDRVLSWTAGRLERLAGTGFAAQNSVGLDALICPTQTTMEYQNRSGWKGAKPWVEWAYKSSQMASVFKGAVLTLAATGAKDGAGGLFPSSLESSVEIFYREGAPPALVRCPAADMKFIHKSPLNSRAWTLQELVLLRRTVYLAED